MSKYISPEEIAEINAKQNELEKTYREYGKTVNPSTVSLASDKDVRKAADKAMKNWFNARYSEIGRHCEPAPPVGTEAKMMAEIDMGSDFSMMIDEVIKGSDEASPIPPADGGMCYDSNIGITVDRKTGKVSSKAIVSALTEKTKASIKEARDTGSSKYYNYNLEAYVSTRTGNIIGKAPEPPPVTADIPIAKVKKAVLQELHKISVEIQDGKVIRIKGVPEGYEVVVRDTDTSILDGKKLVRELIWTSKGHRSTNILQNDMNPAVKHYEREPGNRYNL